jgi:hypothetical protein
MRENLCRENLPPEAMCEHTISCKYTDGGHATHAKVA